MVIGKASRSMRGREFLLRYLQSEIVKLLPFRSGSPSALQEANFRAWLV
jgi:hypothetical protein